MLFLINEKLILFFEVALYVLSGEAPIALIKVISSELLKYEQSDESNIAPNST